MVEEAHSEQHDFPPAFSEGAKFDTQEGGNRDSHTQTVMIGVPWRQTQTADWFAGLRGMSVWRIFEVDIISWSIET